jgi:hypothetical protein
MARKQKERPVSLFSQIENKEIFLFDPMADRKVTG